MIPPADPLHALDWVQFLAAAAAALASAEFLALRRELAPAEFLGWPLMGRLASRRRFPWPGHWMGGVMRERGVLAVAGVRLLGALWLLLPGRPGGAAGDAAALAVVLGAGLLLMQRVPYGLEGCDQLNVIALAGLLLARLAPGNTTLAAAVAWFLALQVTLAYFTAGVVKVRERGWRDGSLLAGVLGTEFYGHAGLAHLLRRPAVARAAIWGVIVFELGFPLIFLLPPAGVAVLLGVGLLFHVTLAFAMGLNGFVWSFAAVYPAIYWCAAR